MKQTGFRAFCTLFLALLLAPLSHAADAPVLRILNWAGFVEPDVISDFEKAQNVRIEYVSFTNVDEFATQLFDQRNQFDLIFPPTRMVNILSANGYLSNIDSDRLPEKQDIRANIINNYYQQDDGAPNAVPYMWGTTGLGVNTRRLKELGLQEYQNSWALLFDPAVRKKAAQCGIGLLNERDELFAAALLYLGYSANTLNHKQLDEAGNLLKDALKDISYLHTAQFRKDLVDGKLCVAVGYSGDLLSEFARAHDLAYFVPKEGAAIRMVAMGIPSNAKQSGLAYRFMEYLMRPEVAARNSVWLHSPSVMASAEQFVSPEILANPAIYPEVSMLRQMETLSPRDRKTNRYVHRLWVDALCTGRSWCAVPMVSEY